jgi:precorrin-6B C5,15-methyltransferase / cobalt-precorrin-6B C5,C15-methyltransferase
MTSQNGSAGSGRVLVIGVADDGPSSLPAALLERVQHADLLVGGRRHLELFPTGPTRRLVIAGGLEPVLQQIEAVPAHQQTVVLASGDPCYFGIGPILAERLGREHVEIIPHVSSVALAFSRLGVAWQDARVVSAHGRPLNVASRAAAGARKLAFLTDETNTPSAIGEALLQAGADDVRAWVFEHLGGERERATETTLGSLADQRFAALNVLVVPDLSWRAESPLQSGFGLPESAFEHTARLITKPEIRAVSLSKLRLRPGGVLWDVGAGSGSLSIEAAGLASGLRVIAVERSAKQLPLIHQNIARFGLGDQITVVEGEAPEALAHVPNPDAVFVGGSGGRLIEILDMVLGRIDAQGRIVVNLVTFEHIATVLDWARARNIGAEVVQISVSRGSDILGMTRLQSENPVTVVSLTP